MNPSKARIKKFLNKQTARIALSGSYNLCFGFGIGRFLIWEREKNKNLFPVWLFTSLCRFFSYQWKRIKREKKQKTRETLIESHHHKKKIKIDVLHVIKFEIFISLDSFRSTMSSCFFEALFNVNLNWFRFREKSFTSWIINY